jgi:hypothetical protein
MTAKSLDEGQWSFNGGASFPLEGAGSFLPDIRLSYGLTNSFDIWIRTDILSYGLGVKYSLEFLQDSIGFIPAFYAGIGGGISSYRYVGIINSFRYYSFEPYLSIRYNYIDVNEDLINETTNEISNEIWGDNSNDSTVVENLDFTYMQLNIGSRFWINENFYWGIEGSVLFTEFGSSAVGSLYLGL